MPTPGDPSFDRLERANRAKEAASGASDERLAELREKYLAPAATPKRAAARSARSAPAPRPKAAAPKPSPIDAGAIARTARAALDKHPMTWTSYAELCSAMGLTRSLAAAVARTPIFEPTGSHWFRVRDDHGVYEVPAAEAERPGAEQPGDEPSDAEHPTAEEADRRLEALGVAIVDGRADPARKLAWTGSGWALHGEDR